MLTIATSADLDALAERVCNLFAMVPRDPMIPEWVAVPPTGVQRWLALRLARELGATDSAGDGIAANIIFHRPNDLLRSVLEAAEGTTSTRPALDPWSTGSLRWTVLGAVVDDPALAEACGCDPTEPDPSWALRAATVFDRYHTHRPDMIRRWVRGHDVDGAGRSLDEGHRWQPRLWRAVRQTIQAPSVPERLGAALDAVRDGTVRLALGDRLVFFGFDSFPGGQLFGDVVDAVAEHHDVHVLMHSPAPGALVPEVDLGDPSRVRSVVHDAAMADGTRHPLVRSWATRSRETAALIATRALWPTPELVGCSDDSDEVPSSLLATLQADVQHNRAPRRALTWNPDDDSIRFHVCSGAARQVEVLRDSLVHVLNDHPELTEDDIVVVCGDLDRFAPIIRSVFSPASLERSDGTEPSLRFSLMDRSFGHDDDVVETLVQLLNLANGPMRADELLEFIALSSVRESFGFDDHAVEQIRIWFDDHHVRWGLDSAHRARFGVPSEVRTNTVRAAVDAVLAGTAIGFDDTLCVGEILADTAAAGRREIAGSFADLIAHLDRIASEIETDRTIGEWIGWVRRWFARLITRDDRTDRGVERVRRLLDDLERRAVEAGGVGSTTAITFTAARRVLVERLADRPARGEYGRGGVTVVPIGSLRAVPYAVVAVLGLDEGFITGASVDGDDLLALDPRLGDPDQRGSRLAALLDAVLAARRHLVVLRDGTNLANGMAVVESTTFAALRDACAATLADPRSDDTDGGIQAVHPRLVTVHPRHGTDEACFIDGALRRDGPWSVDPRSLQGALAHRAQRSSEASWLLASSSEPPTVALDDLRQFLTNASGFYLSKGLELRLGEDVAPPETSLPIALDGLESWQVRSNLLDTLLFDPDFDPEQPDEADDATDNPAVARAFALESARGTLPVGFLGDHQLVASLAELTGIITELRRRIRDPELLEYRGIEVPIDPSTTLTGSVRLTTMPSPGALRWSASKCGAKHLLHTWLDLMLLVAADPSTCWHAVSIQREDADQTKWDPRVDAVIDLVSRAEDPVEAQDEALRALSVIAALSRQGRREPIPFFPSVSHLVALGSTTDTWRPSGKHGDGSSAANEFLYGSISLTELLEIPCEPRDSVWTDQTDRPRVEMFAEVIWGLVDATCRSAGPGAP